MTVLVTKVGRVPLGAKASPTAGLGSRYDLGVDGFQTGIALLSSISGFADYASLYRSQPWVYIGVNKIARAVARLPLKTYVVDLDGNRDRAREPDPLVMLTRNPNPRMGRYQFVEAVVSSIYIFGNALVAKEARPNGARAPRELWMLDWRKIKVIRGDDGQIESYTFNGTTGRRVFKPEDVLHFRWYSPDGTVGVSPLEPLARTLALEDAALRHSTNLFKFGVRPNAIVSVQQRLNPQQRNALAAELRNSLGGPDKSGGLGIVDGGADIKEWGQNAVDSEMISLRKLNREEVAAALQIDPTQIGILDRATFNNVEEAHRGFYMDTLGPPIDMVENVVQTQLIAPEVEFAGRFVEFDLNDVLKGNVEQRSAAYQRFLQSGTMTPNEIRRLENLPAIDDRGADSIYVPLNMKALDGRFPSNTDSPVGQPALAPSSGN